MSATGLSSNGLECPECGHGVTDVMDSRPVTVRNGGKKLIMVRRRRRKCRQCACRFTSYEHVFNEKIGKVLELGDINAARLAISHLHPIDQRAILVELLARTLGISVRTETGDGGNVGDGVASAQAPVGDGETASM